MGGRQHSSVPADEQLFLWMSGKFNFLLPSLFIPESWAGEMNESLPFHL